MRIYCRCNFCNNIIYLGSSALTRRQLATSWGVYFFVNCNSCQSENQINVNSVSAESSHNKTPYATTAGGGLLGVMAGPIGVIIGLALGGIAGGVAITEDRKAVNIFNNSYI